MQQPQQEHNPSRRIMSGVKSAHKAFLVVDGLQWDLSNLTIGSPSCEESQQPEDPSSPRGSISSLSHPYEDDSGSGERSVASYPSSIQYPSQSEIPACLDVDGIFEKLRVGARRGRLANPQLSGLTRSREKPFNSPRPFQTRMATSSRTSSGVGVDQQPSRRKSSQSPDSFRSLQRMERQDDSDDPMEEMVRRDEFFRTGHHQDQDFDRSKRHKEDNHRDEDPFQRMEEYRSRMRSKQDDDYHQQSRRDDSYHDRSSRRHDDYHGPTTSSSSSSSSRRDNNYRRNYDDYDRSNDHESNHISSSNDRCPRDDDFHRSSFDDYPSPRSSQQHDGRKRRQEDSRHRGAPEDSYDEGGYRRQEDYHHRGWGSSREEFRNNHDSRRPPRDDYNSPRYCNDDTQQHQQDYSDEDYQQDLTLVEVTPGYVVPLRGSAETWVAVQSGRIQTTTCFICRCRLVCVDDADMVMCPGCRSISPAEGGGGGGLGLGMREEDASTEQLKRLEGKSRRVEGLYER